MKLSLKPTDTFFFRDGKPFSRGEESEATNISIFPPFPSTVYGALRGAYINEKGWDKFKTGQLEDSIGTKDTYHNASFRLKGVFLESAKYRTVYFPLPRDLVAEKLETPETSTDKITIYQLSPSAQSVLSNSPLSSVLVKPQSIETDVEYPSEGAFINYAMLKSYLLAKNEPLKLYPTKAFLEFEPKIGIARSRETLTAEEGHLYRLNMMRLDNEYHMIVDFEGIEFFESEQATDRRGILKLGGENRPFVYQPSNNTGIMEYTPDERQALIRTIATTRQFKLYLAAPAIWESKKHGWYPRWMDAKQEFTYKNLTCKLLTAAVGSYQTVGGWEIEHHRPKRMYRAVPAGSVYYLELVKGDAEKVLEVFHYKNIVDYEPETGRAKEDWAKEGFGLMFVGVIKEERS